MREDIKKKFLEAIKKIDTDERFGKVMLAYIKEDRQAVYLTNYINNNPDITKPALIYTIVAIDQKEEGITKAISEIVLEE